MKPYHPWLAAGCLLAASACDPTVQGSNRAADASQRAFHDMSDKWRSVFSYHPQGDTTPQMPQSRYCYETQADIVCYDSPQPDITAKIKGYQDGANISWYQPGGGALGVSGGPPTANYRTEVVHTAPPEFVDLDGRHAAEARPAPAPAPVVVTAAPFETGESSYQSNSALADAISVGNR